jgi:hypothetical protein
METTHLAVKDFKWHRAQASPNWGLLEAKAKDLAASKNHKNHLHASTHASTSTGRRE